MCCNQMLILPPRSLLKQTGSCLPAQTMMRVSTACPASLMATREDQRLRESTPLWTLPPPGTSIPGYRLRWKTPKPSRLSTCTGREKKQQYPFLPQLPYLALQLCWNLLSYNAQKSFVSLYCRRDDGDQGESILYVEVRVGEINAALIVNMGSR